MGISLKDLEAATWIPAGPDCDGCQIGDVYIYKFRRDGHCSMATRGGGWVSALFVSLEAAASWADDLDGAEAMFKRLNPPTGKGENLVPLKVSNPPQS